MRPFALVAAIALVVPARPASAQSAAPPGAAQSLPAASLRAAPPHPAATAVAPGPRREVARSGVSPVVEDEGLPVPAPIPLVQESRRRNGQILTIVGGAIFVVGMLMDDDDVGTVVALGGLAVGVYGLIQWLQASMTGVTGATNVANVTKVSFP